MTETPETPASLDVSEAPPTYTEGQWCGKALYQCLVCGYTTLHHGKLTAHLTTLHHVAALPTAAVVPPVSDAPAAQEDLPATDAMPAPAPDAEEGE